MIVPTIVVIAYNRVESLQRLLVSLSSAQIPTGIRLVISVDRWEKNDVRECVDQFRWNFGEKRVISHPRRLGLKEHVLAAGDLVNEYGSIIMLEDDLIVSPYFFQYAADALEFYKNDGNIGGISLYNHRMNFNTRFPFLPIEDGSDVYFLQFASSWGQAWNKEQWNGFRTWFAGDDHQFDANNSMPSNVNGWPASSWLKSFSKYLVQNSKYFIYPRVSLTSNFGDAGTHLRVSDALFQVPVLFGEHRYQFLEFNNSYCRYDSHFELLSGSVKKIQPKLEQFAFEMSMSLTKTPEQIKEQYVLAAFPSANALRSFGMELKPIEANILCDIGGTGISLMTREEYAALYSAHYRRHMFFEYYFRRPKVKEILFLIAAKVRRSIMRLLP